MKTGVFYCFLLRFCLYNLTMTFTAHRRRVGFFPEERLSAAETCWMIQLSSVQLSKTVNRHPCHMTRLPVLQYIISSTEDEMQLG